MSTKTNALQADLAVVQGNKSPFALEDWVVEPEFNRLTRGGVTHRLEPKVMQVLLRLAAQPRHVVAKDELIRSVWLNTYVTEDGLTRCVSLLRNVLGDDAHHPHFIQTISKVGYCLMVGISLLPTGETESLPDHRLALPAIPDRQTRPESEVITVPAALAVNEDEPRSKAPESSSVRSALSFSVPVLTLALVIGFAYWAVPAMHANQGQRSYKTFQLTADAGEQSDPEFSSDGKLLAFVWAKEDGSPRHIYIKELGHESLQRLTNLDDSEFSPIWSPDGKQIAFLSASAKGLGLYIASLGSSAALRKVYIPEVNTRWQDGALSWSPDGKSIALVDHVGAQASSAIYLLDLTTLRIRMLTTPPAGWEGDLSPVFSPAGDKIAFVRASESWIRDLYWVSTSGEGPHRITSDGSLIKGITWSSDKRWVAFASNRAGQFALWKVAIDGTNLQRLPVGTENASQPAISQTGADLAFVQSSALFDILRIANPKVGSAEPNKRRIVSSTANDSAASVSPDGTQFAFQSWRSGEQQIWIAGIEGQALRQLTPNGGRLSIAGTPAWAPDGSWVAFDARQSGHSHIYVVAATGGSPLQLTFGEVNDIIPRWSIDGRSVYFRSNRGGRWQIWKQSVAGGKPQQLTSDDGINAQESADGKWLYFARGAESGIWRIPTSGGEPVRVLDQPATGYWGYWSVSKNAIYFLDQRQQASISSYNPATGKATLFVTLDHLPRRDFSGMSALSDRQELLLSDTHNASRHIIIAKGTF
jgi:Tol biopolymer transport system component/DNA-binding winged helix-turn-helix (wHTH) protein